MAPKILPKTMPPKKFSDGPKTILRTPAEWEIHHRNVDKITDGWFRTARLWSEQASEPPPSMGFVEAATNNVNNFRDKLLARRADAAESSAAPSIEAAETSAAPRIEAAPPSIDDTEQPPRQRSKWQSGKSQRITTTSSTDIDQQQPQTTSSSSSSSSGARIPTQLPFLIPAVEVISDDDEPELVRPVPMLFRGKLGGSSSREQLRDLFRKLG